MAKKRTNATEYVDLGLPSGTKWAKSNIGASEETGYGKYFQYGAVNGYAEGEEYEFTWQNAPFNNGSEEYDEEYFNEHRDEFIRDGKLAPEYDAAMAIEGNGSEMPSVDDFRELVENTDSEWMDDYNGVAGRVFRSRTNDASLFFPASGFRNGGETFGTGINFGLWATTLSSETGMAAWKMNSRSDNVSVNTNGRECGMVIRPVRK